MAAKLFNTPAFLGLLSNTTFGLVQFLVIALYPAIANASDIKISQLILGFTIGSLLFIWSAPYWAKKSDELGRQKILRVGLIGLTISFAFIIFLTEAKLNSDVSFLLLILSRLIYGLTASAIVSVVQAWWRDQDGDVTKNMISHSMGLNLGRFLAPLFILALGGNLSILLKTILGWLIVLTAASFFAPSLAPKKITIENVDEDKISQPILVAFFATLFVGLVHSNLAHVIKTSLELSTEYTSMLTSKVLLMSSIAVLLFQFLFKKLGSFKGKTLIRTGIIAWMISTVFFVDMKSESELWLGLLFISLGLAVITPGYLSMLKAGGKSAGIMSSTQTLGLTFGGLTGFLVLQGYVSFAQTLMGVSLLLVILCFRFSAPKEVTC